MIATGLIGRCHKQFGDHRDHQFDIWHCPKRWGTESLTLDSLDWLRHRMPLEPFCPLIDQYGTHMTEAVKKKGEPLGIELIWIPKGATGGYQPLNRRTVGALKAKGRAKWRNRRPEHCEMGCTRAIAAELLTSLHTIPSHSISFQQPMNEDSIGWCISADPDTCSANTQAMLFVFHSGAPRSHVGFRESLGRQENGMVHSHPQRPWMTGMTHHTSTARRIQIRCHAGVQPSAEMHVANVKHLKRAQRESSSQHSNIRAYATYWHDFCRLFIFHIGSFRSTGFGNP
jgi:hypothetical protein